MPINAALLLLNKADARLWVSKSRGALFGPRITEWYRGED